VRLFVTALAVLLLEGCCTTKACVGGITFQLGPAADEFVIGEPVTVRACLDAECTDETLTRTSTDAVAQSATMVQFGQTLFFEPPAGITAGTHTISLELTRGGSVVLNVVKEMVVAEGFAPNGPTCGGSCIGATVSL
jgi:hypothetical protein